MKTLEVVIIVISYNLYYRSKPGATGPTCSLSRQ